MSHNWDGPERRKEYRVVDVMAEIEAVQRSVDETRESSERRHKELCTRMDHMSHSTISAIETQNKTISEIHRLFIKAFPEGDAEAHRKSHESWIEKEKQDREFWLKLKQHVINWAVVAVIGWGGIVLWAAFLSGPKG